MDEAHNLSTDVLEEIRLLTNLETAQSKLLQILLIGQPELEEKLDSSNLRQLKQRIALRSHLGALSLEETCGYVYRRLQVAGHGNPAQLFPMETVLELHQQSRGLPRLINTLCENAMIHGYAQQSPNISPEMIEEIAADFRLNVERPSMADVAMRSERTAEVERAARTLLDLYEHLRTTRDNGGDSRITIGAGARKNEPYI